MFWGDQSYQCTKNFQLCQAKIVELLVKFHLVDEKGDHAQGVSRDVNTGFFGESEFLGLNFLTLRLMARI